MKKYFWWQSKFLFPACNCILFRCQVFEKRETELKIHQQLSRDLKIKILEWFLMLPGKYAKYYQIFYK